MIKQLKTRYFQLAHAMQTGVAAMMNYDKDSTSPKHLRVGVNSAMVNDMALVQLLVAKGVITEEEYFSALVVQMGEEVDRYKAELAKHGLTNVELG